MADLLFDLLFLLLGFVLLGKGADWLVEGGAALARRWGISHMMVGLTVVAWGTSMPEVLVSSFAAWEGRGATSLGNALGSNVANIGLVLGSATLILPVLLASRAASREILWLLGSLALLWYLCGDGAVTRQDACVLLSAFASYNLHLVLSFRDKHSSAPETEAEKSVKRPRFLVAIGCVAIFLGAELVTMGAEGIAVRAGMSEIAIGLTVLAIGTSLPELAAGVSSALKGHADMSFGNVMGSNVFNTLGVIGVAAMVQPFGVGSSEASEQVSVALTRDFPVTAAFSVGLILLPFAFTGRFRRGKATLLVVGYLSYLGLLLVQDTTLL